VEAGLVVTLYVQPAGPRPDFRAVLVFIWGAAADCDTDGDSQHPADRKWTELYAQNHSRPDEVFDVVAASTEPLMLAVDSPIEWLAAAVAHLLAEVSGGSVSSEPGGPFAPPGSVLSRVGAFDVQAAWARYWVSPFQQATADNPYPNLNS
jgi:hypothetical protein